MELHEGRMEIREKVLRQKVSQEDVMAQSFCAVTGYRETEATFPSNAIAGSNSHLVVLQQLALECTDT